MLGYPLGGWAVVRRGERVARGASAVHKVRIAGIVLAFVLERGVLDVGQTTGQVRGQEQQTRAGPRNNFNATVGGRFLVEQEPTAVCDGEAAGGGENFTHFSRSTRGVVVEIFQECDRFSA